MAPFNWSEFRRTCHLAGPWHDPEAAHHGWYPLDLPLPPVTPCCYVVVDVDGHVLYVGKVQREDHRGLRGRFSAHHRRHDGWHAVWVLPLRRDTSAISVTNTEAVLISILRPLENDTAPAIRGA